VEDDLSRLSAAADDDSRLLEQLARQAAFGGDMGALEKLSDRLGVALEPLLFYGRMLAAPFVSVAVEPLEQTGLPPPRSSACCPYCGSPPGLATLEREDGKRVLCCSLCGEDWEFARLECPFCGNQGELDVLSVDGDDPYSIESCSTCKGYLKTVDRRKLPEDHPVVPLVETIATLYLDLIAETEGCSRGLPYAALR